MNHINFRFQVGEFVEVEIRAGNNRVGRIFSLTEDTLSVTWWKEDTDRESNPDTYYLPKILIPTSETDVINKTTLSSIIFMFDASEISNFNVRFVLGMTVMRATFVEVQLSFSFQSITRIIFADICQISIELQRILSNRQGNQFTFASSNIQTSHLTWSYLKEKLAVPVHFKDKVCTISTIRSNDLATLRVKSRIPCEVMRVEERDSINRVMAVFGISAIIGVRKQPPATLQRIMNQGKVVVRGGVQLKDVINLVDVTDNNFNAQQQRFSFNAYGNKGIDFIFFPSQQSLRMSVRYKHFVVESALPKLTELGVASPRNNERLSDDELERLLRG
jgi:hypothetical protein